MKSEYEYKTTHEYPAAGNRYDEIVKIVNRTIYEMSEFNGWDLASFSVVDSSMIVFVWRRKVEDVKTA